MHICGNFRIKIHGYDNFQNISFAHFWTDFEDFCVLALAPCCGIQCHQPALHRADAVCLGSISKPRWKQIGKA